MNTLRVGSSLMIVCLLAVACEDVGAASTQITLTSKANGATVSPNAGMTPQVQIGGGLKFLNTSFTIEYDTTAAKVNANCSVNSFINTSKDFVTGDLPQLMTGDWGALPTPTVTYGFGGTRIGSVSGQVDTYAFHAGTSGSNTAEVSTAFAMIDTLDIYVPVATTLELPLHVGGGATAFAFGDPADTYGYARLSITGSLGGTSIGSFECVADSRIGVTLASINESRLVTVDLAAGDNQINFILVGTAASTSKAKGMGGFIPIPASASSVANFPNTIYAGFFTGPGGTPLPAGTTITGEIGVDYPAAIVPEPATLSLVASGLALLAMRRRRVGSSLARSS